LIFLVFLFYLLQYRIPIFSFVLRGRRTGQKKKQVFYIEKNAVRAGQKKNRYSILKKNRRPHRTKESIKKSTLVKKTLGKENFNKSFLSPKKYCGNFFTWFS